MLYAVKEEKNQERATGPSAAICILILNQDTKIFSIDKLPELLCVKGVSKPLGCCLRAKQLSFNVAIFCL